MQWVASEQWANPGQIHKLLRKYKNAKTSTRKSKPQSEKKDRTQVHFSTFIPLAGGQNFRSYFGSLRGHCARLPVSLCACGCLSVVGSQIPVHENCYLVLHLRSYSSP